MDRQARKLARQREESSEKNKASTPTATGSADDSATSSTATTKASNESNNKVETPISDDEDMITEDASKPRCSNCGILCHVTHATNKGEMCGTCHQVIITYFSFSSLQPSHFK